MKRSLLGGVALVALTLTTAAEPLPNWETHVVCAKEKSRGECMGLEVDAWDYLYKKWDRIPAAQRKECLLAAQKPGEESYRKIRGCAEKHLATIEADAQAKADAEAKRKADAARAAKAAAEEAKRAADADAAAKKAADSNASQKAAADDAAAEMKRFAASYAPLAALWTKEQADDYAASVKQADAEMLAWRKADAAAAPAAAPAPAPAPVAQPADDGAAEAKRAAERAAEAKRLADAYAPLTAAWAKDQADDYAASVKQADAEMLAWRKADAAEAALRAKAADDAAAAAATATAAKAKADADAEAKRRVEAQACQTKLREVAKAGTILFASGKADLNAKSNDTLAGLAAAAKGCPGLKIRIEGHTDATGNEASNLTLSRDRAEAIVEALKKAGVEATRLEAAGFGETRPLVPNDNSENRAKNRRIEFVVE